LDTLRGQIAEAIWKHVSAQDVPAVATRLGLAPGTEGEAFHSKRRYIRTRILGMDEADLLKIARAVVAEYGDQELSDAIAERTAPTEPRVTELTRRDVLKALNPLESLFGETDLFEGLRIIYTGRIGAEEGDRDLAGLQTLTGRIRQHYRRNPDWSHEELLIECGALTANQTRFFRLIEKLLHPVVRRGDPQRDLATALNTILAADGFRAVVSGEQSRRPLYTIERISSGVAGRPKNLIFAAINAKPDLYFTDAINNDIAIRNATDALIYDEFLNESGLLWQAVVQWWQAREHLSNLTEAQRTLYTRLLQSVKAAHSPGQYALFSTYYHEFPTRMGNALPALIPEVHLHYDPRTRQERGADPVLLRQRMDFLLLLDHNVRVVIEIDGSQHYSEAGRAAPSKYAEMVAEDRRLRLLGYELYRFGAAEFDDTVSTADGKIAVGPQSRRFVVEFFNSLWRRHEINL
jgi:hypothetical protein